MGSRTQVTQCWDGMECSRDCAGMLTWSYCRGNRTNFTASVLNVLPHPAPPSLKRPDQVRLAGSNWHGLRTSAPVGPTDVTFPFGGNIETREKRTLSPRTKGGPLLSLLPVFGNLWQLFPFKHMTIKSLRVPMPD